MKKGKSYNEIRDETLEEVARNVSRVFGVLIALAITWVLYYLVRAWIGGMR